MHNVGTPTPNEPDGRYDTPSLVEVYRTAPYFHDGRAANLKDAMTKHGLGKHGHVEQAHAAGNRRPDGVSAVAVNAIVGRSLTARPRSRREHCSVPQSTR